MDQAALLKLAIALGATFAVYKFVPNAAAKAACLGVAGVIIAKQVPYIKDSLA